MIVSDTKERQVMFTAIDGSVIRTNLSLPGNFFTPPKFLQFKGKLYSNTGSSLSSNFYREVDDFQIIED